MANSVGSPEPAAADASYPSPRKAWWMVFVLLILSCLSLVDRQIMVLLVPQIRADLHINDFQMGLMQGFAFSFFYVTFGLFFGWLVDRGSRRGVVFLGVSFWSLATAACGLAANSMQLMVARFGVGAGEAALNPASYSILSDAFPKKRLSFALSVWGVGGHIGVGISLLIGGYLVANVPPEGMVVPLFGQLSAWRIVFLAAGLPGLLIGLLIWTMGDPPRRDRLRATSLSAAETFRFVAARWRFYTGHAIGYALISAGGFGYNGWAAVYLMRRFKLDVSEVVALLAPVAVIGGMTGVLLAGAITDRLFARGMKDAHLRVFIVLAPLQAVFHVAAANSSSPGWFAFWGLMICMTLGFIGVSAAALQLVTPNNLRGQVSAAYQFVVSLLGAGLGTAAVGAITTYVFKDDNMVGWGIALNALIVCPLAAVALIFALKPMRQAIDQASAWSQDAAPQA